MLTNFEDITCELDPDEKKLIPIIISGLKLHYENEPITAPEIVRKINERSEVYNLSRKFTQARLRKIIHYLRENSLLPVIATSKGYFISYNKVTIRSQINSMNERANSIINAANGLKKFLYG